jgi:uncharacterized membrane protein YeiH
LAGAAIGGVTAHLVRLSTLPYLAIEAVAISLLITVGVQKALAYHAPAPSAMLIGVVAVTAGASVADLLTSRQVAIMGEGAGLLGAIVVGAVVFWLLTIYVAFYPAVVVTILVVVSLRVVSVHFGWTTPFFPGHDSDSPAT